LAKLKAATRSQTSPCQALSANASSNSARQNSQNTTTLPVESAISGACQAETAKGEPMVQTMACTAEPSASATASRPAVECLKSRTSAAASTRSRPTVAARNASSTAASDIQSVRSSSPHRF